MLIARDPFFVDPAFSAFLLAPFNGRLRIQLIIANSVMKLTTVVSTLITATFLSTVALGADTPAPETPIFKDKNLEAAVRKFVFEKRDNDKPLTESDLANLSTIQATGKGIKDLTGLEKCQNLASLDLAQNEITDLSPLKGLSKLQYLNLADNRILDVRPLATVTALQYIELSHNQVKSLRPLSGLTNLASLYVVHNRVTDIYPVVQLKKLSSLYLDNNQIEALDDVSGLKSLSTLSVRNNLISDLSPLEGLNNLYFLFLENNEIRDLSPLVRMAKKDSEGEKRFAPFLKVYLDGNPLSADAKQKQIPQLKECGVKVF